MGLADLHREFSGKTADEVAVLISGMPVVDQRSLYAELSELDRVSREERLHFFEGTRPPYNDQHGFLHRGLDIAIGLLSGGNRCLGGETEIFDPVLGISRRVDEIDSVHHVLSWDGSALVVAVCEVPFCKGIDDLYDVTLSSGEVFTCSLSHRVLTRDGYCAVSDCPVGCAVFHPQTSLAPSLSVLFSGAFRLTRRVRDFLFYYLRDFCLCGARLLLGSSIVRYVSPSPVGVRAHTSSLISLHGGDLGSRCECILPSLRSFLPSSRGVRHRFLVRFSGILSRVFYRPYKSVLDRIRVCSRSMLAFSLQLSNFGFGQSDNRSFSTTASITSYSAITSIRYKRRDVKWDFTVPRYNNYLAGGAIHHNSGKSETGCVDAGLLLCGVHPVRSVKYPAPVYIRHISPSQHTTETVILRKLKTLMPRAKLKGGSWDSAYSAGSRLLTMADGGFMQFFNDTQDVGVMGGIDLDAVYIDEHCRYDVFVESMARLVDRDGYMVFTMTPEHGLGWEQDELYESSDPSRKVWYFDIRKNPHLNKKGVADFVKSLEGSRLFDVKVCGIPTALSGQVYPEFSRDVHVIADKDLPSGWHRQVVVDAHLRTATAILWRATSPAGISYVYREAVWNSETESGGVPRMAEKIKALTGGVEYIHQFIIDEAMGGEGKNIFDQASVKLQLIKCGLPFLGTNEVGGKGFEAGVNLVRTALSINPTTGKPRHFIFESCPGVIKQYERYRFKRKTRADEETLRESVATVDDHFVDCDRYGFMAKPSGDRRVEVISALDGVWD